MHTVAADCSTRLLALFSEVRGTNMQDHEWRSAARGIFRLFYAARGAILKPNVVPRHAATPRVGTCLIDVRSCAPQVEGLYSSTYKALASFSESLFGAVSNLGIPSDGERFAYSPNIITAKEPSALILSCAA